MKLSLNDRYALLDCLKVEGTAYDMTVTLEVRKKLVVDVKELEAFNKRFPMEEEVKGEKTELEGDKLEKMVKDRRDETLKPIYEVEFQGDEQAYISTTLSEISKKEELKIEWLSIYNLFCV